MKKLIKTFLIVIFCYLSQLGQNASAQNVVKAYIPDPVFRYFLYTSYPNCMDTSGDSLIIDSAANVSGMINCMAYGIKNLSGIQYFINISKLICSNNPLDSLPNLSSLSKLDTLDCSNDNLTYLPDLSSNKALSVINCAVNKFTTLPDLSANTKLTFLHCCCNKLTSLPDLSSNTSLTTLDCAANPLDSLPDLSANTSLTRLVCYADGLNFLPDLSSLNALTYLDCSENYLTYLPDLSANINLSELRCARNRLVSLPDLSLNTKLISIWCVDNQLTSLPDLSANTKLKRLDCSKNQLTSLPKISESSELTNMTCYDNFLDFSDASDIRYYDSLNMLEFFWYYPQKPFGNGDTVTLCKGDTLILSIQSQDSALSYQWFVDNKPINNATDTVLYIPYATISQNGKITCKSYGTALNSPPMNFGPGISEFESKPFIVTVKHAIFSGLDTAYCLGVNPLTLIANPTGGYFEGHGIFDTIFYPDTAGIGTHLISYTYDYSGGCISVDTQYVSIYSSIPDLFASSNLLDTVYCLSDDAVALSGLPDGGYFEGSGINNNIFYPDTAGVGQHSIVYIYIYSNGCLAIDTNQVLVQECINNIEDSKTSSIEVYPNPTNGSLQIIGVNYSSFELYNNVGLLLMSSNETIIDISDLINGLYFLRISTNDGKSQIEKIILMK